MAIKKYWSICLLPNTSPKPTLLLIHHYLEKTAWAAGHRLDCAKAISRLLRQKVVREGRREGRKQIALSAILLCLPRSDWIHLERGGKRTRGIMEITFCICSVRNLCSVVCTCLYLSFFPEHCKYRTKLTRLFLIHFLICAHSTAILSLWLTDE